MSSDKPLPITKAMVWKAYQLVKRNGKAAGVDGQSLDDFAKDLENNLYKLWNRMASGSYFPPPVRRVEIPKRLLKNVSASTSQNCDAHKSTIPAELGLVGISPKTRSTRI